MIPDALLIDWACYERANRRARDAYMLSQGQLKVIRERDQRGRKRPQRALNEHSEAEQGSDGAKLSS